MERPNREPDFTWASGRQVHEFYLKERVKWHDNHITIIGVIGDVLYWKEDVYSHKIQPFIDSVQEAYQIYIIDQILLGESK